MKNNTLIIVLLFMFFACNSIFVYAQEYTKLYNLGKQATLKDYIDVENEFNKAVKKNKGDAEVYFLRGKFYFKFYKYDLALQDYNKAIELTPEKYAFYEYRSDLFLETDNLDALLKDVNTMMKMDATIPNAHVYKGRYFMKIDSLNEAFNSFDKAIQIYESNNAPCYVMSICYSSRARLNFAFGKIDNAIADFTKAIAKARDSRKDNLLMLRANAYLAKEDIKNAYQDIGAAFASKPDTLTLAYLYALKGDVKKLEEIIPFILEKKSKIEKFGCTNLYNLACLYAIINNKEKALEYVEKSIQNGYDELNWIQADFDMKNIRDLPEFITLIQKYKLAK